MATVNPFDLLGDDDSEDPSLLIAAQRQKTAVPSVAAPKKAQSLAQAKQATQPKQLPNLPSKPLPPAQAVRESRNDVGGRGGRSSAGGHRFGRGRGGHNREYNENLSKNSGPFFAKADAGSRRASERHNYGEPHGGYSGGRHAESNNEEAGDERPRRLYERRSGTGRGNEIKREGAGRGNWGSRVDEFAQVTEEVVNEAEKNLSHEKLVGEEEAAEGNKENNADEAEELEPEDKEMTLEEYEKVLEEKRKALQALKTEERKVDTKAFESMQQLTSKKGGDDVFIKLGSDKDRRKDALEKDEKAKKSVSINEFLKPVEGEKYYGRGRGRGRGRGYGSRDSGSNAAAPSIEDPGHFPTLVAK